MRSRLFRIGFGVSLAVFMGMAGVFGGLAVLPKTALAESESFSTEVGGLIVPKADDPVIFTTESGLDIKYGQRPLFNDSLPSGALSGYPYFTMGTFNGAVVNWVIIGKSTIMNGCDLIGVDGTPAGQAIKGDTNFSLEKYIGMANPDNWNVVANAEIDANCVLVTSEMTFSSSSNWKLSTTYASDYEHSSLKTYMGNLYNSLLGLSDKEKSVIKPQTFTNKYFNPTGESTSTNQYMFPFAVLGEKFTINTYLPTRDLKETPNNGFYNLRSGHTDVYTTGGVSYPVMYIYLPKSYNNGAGDGMGWNAVNVYQNVTLRPCFVMKLG